MRRLAAAISFLYLSVSGSFLHSENYLLNGGQRSKINYSLIQKIKPTAETVSVTLSYVLPENFKSPTYSQTVSNLSVRFTLEPDDKKEWTDKRGNRIVDYSWNNPAGAFEARISFIAENAVSLVTVNTTAAFPVKDLSAAILSYLEPTKMAPVDDPQIKKLSAEIVSGAKTQFDAVQRILSWLIDHMRYVLEPEEFGALYALKTGKGNCQNYSHLAAALMRAQKIPVRIVNGITLKEPYDIKTGDRRLTLNMAQGRHSWIEVYFADLGWVPFDPQQSELFVSNRFIRLETGLDNEETVNDGLVRWTRRKGSNELISFSEIIEADFDLDEVTIHGEKQNYGPANILLVPEVKASFMAEPKEPQVELPVFDPSTIKDLKFDIPYVFGNLEFPEGVNFAFNRTIVAGSDANSQTLEKNFLVETAEYVSGPTDYAQIFVLSGPVLLDKIGLALHNFGGQGTLVVELREDDNMKPGRVAALSKPVNIRSLAGATGYHWVDFDFASQGLVLTPDRYWITLRFDGTPIINWFYSYGKPVGPAEGTQMKLKAESGWPHTLGYEFNYRIIGNTIK
jgi:hypothetical protein